MAKIIQREQRIQIYKAMLEALEFLVNHTDPCSELASLIMGREHIIDALGYVHDRDKLH